MGCCGSQKKNEISESSTGKENAEDGTLYDWLRADEGRMHTKSSGSRFLAWTSILVIAGLVLVYIFGR